MCVASECLAKASLTIEGIAKKGLRIGASLRCRRGFLDDLAGSLFGCGELSLGKIAHDMRKLGNRMLGCECKRAIGKRARVGIFAASCLQSGQSRKRVRDLRVEPQGVAIGR